MNERCPDCGSSRLVYHTLVPERRDQPEEPAHWECKVCSRCFTDEDEEEEG